MQWGGQFGTKTSLVGDLDAEKMLKIAENNYFLKSKMAAISEIKIYLWICYEVVSLAPKPAF